MFYDLWAKKFIFYVKIKLFLAASLTRIWIQICIGMAPWIRIPIETNADPQLCLELILAIQVYEFSSHPT
jgi:hypothetical protein